MKLIGIAIKYCKRIIAILLIILFLLSSTNINYANEILKEGNSMPVVNEIDLEEYQVDKQTINTLLKKAKVSQWEEFKDIMSIGSEFVVIDYYTGYYWVAARYMGANHADVETVDKYATRSLKRVYNDRENWQKRPVLIVFDNGDVYCASSFVVFHAGVDNKECLAIVKNRSWGYGEGENYDYVKNNEADGHNCIHVRKSTNHYDGKINQEHQRNIDILEKEMQRLNE